VALELAKRERLAGIALVNPSIVTPADLGAVSVPLGVVLAELDPLHDRAAWAEVLQSLDGALSIVPGATRTYQRGLPEVGKAVASLVGRAGPRRGQGNLCRDPIVV
jgi:hypothetical protein